MGKRSSIEASHVVVHEHFTTQWQAIGTVGAVLAYASESGLVERR